MTFDNSLNMELMLKLTAGRRKYLQTAADRLSIVWSRIPLLQHIRHNDGCSQSQISAALGITPAAVAQILPKMITDELVMRENDSMNRRANKLYITEKGMAALKKGSELFDNIDRIMFEGISAADSEKLFEILGKVNVNLNRELSAMGIGGRFGFADTV